MPALTTSLLHSVRDPQLRRILAESPKLGHEHNWEGEFTGTGGAASQCVIGVKARIALHGDLVEGAGRAINFPAEWPASDAEFAIAGTIDPENIGFQMWFACDQIRHEPFIASGTLSGDGRAMTGDWSLRCFNPGTCDCEGGDGIFRLKRID